MNKDYIYNWLKLHLSEGRYLHVLGAEKAARELAVMFNEDPERAALAGLIHDNAKGFSHEQSLQIIKDNNFSIDDDIKNNHKIIHAFLGAYLAKKEFHITDEGVLDAIRYHTTGRVNMTMLEKIVFLADKIEEKTRSPQFRAEVLEILKESGNIDKAVLFCVDKTIRSLLDRKLVINSQTIDVWNYYIKQA